MKMEQTECSETSAYKIPTPGNYPKKTYNIQNMVKVWNQEDEWCFVSQVVLNIFFFCFFSSMKNIL